MSSSHFPAAAVQCRRAVFGGFTLPWGSGSQERGGCLSLSRPASKKTARETRGGPGGVRGSGDEEIKKAEGGRTEGQGDGGEGSERRRTMRLLMRTFWGAYVGHCMNKQTFTTLHR